MPVTIAIPVADDPYEAVDSRTKSRTSTTLERPALKPP
jgi:hypothetical protein